MSLIVVLAVFLAAAVLIDMDADPFEVALVSLIALVVYGYVLYKRYHVEVVPESDIDLFDDPDDLRILCSIYGLDDCDDESKARKRLVDFVRTNRGRAYTWVAPRAVLTFGSTFELTPPLRSAPVGAVPAKPLVGGKARSDSRLSGIRSCPLCDAAVSGKTTICPECGTDLEFYSALSETKIGKRLISRKNVAVRRKLRYSVPSSGDDR